MSQPPPLPPPTFSPPPPLPFSDKIPVGLQWYYTRERDAIGPISSEALQALWKAGELKPCTLAVEVGKQVWQPILEAIEGIERKVGGETQSAKGCGMIIAGMAGTVPASGLIIVGLLFSLTGIGAIIGIPLILAGLFVGIFAPLLGLSARSGKCPYCNAPVLLVAGQAGLDCPACKRRILVKGKKLDRLD